jgi:hypothetical protein
MSEQHPTPAPDPVELTGAQLERLARFVPERLAEELTRLGHHEPAPDVTLTQSTARGPVDVLVDGFTAATGKDPFSIWRIAPDGLAERLHHLEERPDQ